MAKKKKRKHFSPESKKLNCFLCFSPAKDHSHQTVEKVFYGKHPTFPFYFSIKAVTQMSRVSYYIMRVCVCAQARAWM